MELIPNHTETSPLWTYFMIALAVAFIFGPWVYLILCAITATMRSSQISRDEEFDSWDARRKS